MITLNSLVIKTVLYEPYDTISDFEWIFIEYKEGEYIKYSTTQVHKILYGLRQNTKNRFVIIYFLDYPERKEIDCINVYGVIFTRA